MNGTATWCKDWSHCDRRKILWRTHRMEVAASAPYVRSRLSVMMFLQYAIWGAWLPILYPFLMGHRGFSLDQTGLCLMAGAVGALIGPFIAGQLADRSFATEKLLAVSHFIGAILVFFLASAAKFEVFLGISFIYGLVYAPTMALTNSIAFANLPDRDRDFPTVRLWGTIGWIAAGITIGQILFRYYNDSDATLNEGRGVGFLIAAGLGVVMALYCLTLPNTPPTKSATAKTAWLEGVQEIFRRPLIVLFAIAVPISMIHQFYFVFTSDFVTNVQKAANSESADAFSNWINQIFGVGGGGLMTVGQMTEIVVLAALPFFTKVFSRKQLLLTGIAAYAARMALFAFAPELPTVIIGIALHGLCFGCFIAVAFMVVDENTTPDIRATAQNLFNLVIVGIGIIVGSLFATSVVAKYASEGGSMDYVKLFSVPMYMALGCFVLMLLFYPSKSKKLDSAK
jgi:nucleoside transporter